jgi:hypothetical protein
VSRLCPNINELADVVFLVVDKYHHLIYELDFVMIIKRIPRREKKFNNYIKKYICR